MQWYPFFQSWGHYKANKVQHLLVTWGRLKIYIFSISALIPSVKAHGADFQLLHQ
jgi:hypothetical protein